MYVACSTLCFGRLALEDALRKMADLEFSRYDVAIHEHGRQLRPSEVVGDVQRAATRLRFGPGLMPAAFSVEIDAPSEEEYQSQFHALCRLARLTAVPLITLPAAPLGTEVEPELKRLARLLRVADAEGVLLCLDTCTGTLTEDPEQAVALCEKLPGLGLTLDPSHYLAGPNQGHSWDVVYPFVRHLHLRDTGRGANQFQVRIGQGALEYGRIISHLARCNYDRALTVDIRDIPDAPFAMEPEVRKLKYLLESLI
jgi:sugar phosphate isomerase/epimerase